MSYDPKGPNWKPASVINTEEEILEQMIQAGASAKAIEDTVLYKRWMENKQKKGLSPMKIQGIPQVADNQLGALPIGAGRAAKRQPWMPDKNELMRVLASRLRMREGDMYPLHIDFCVKPEKVYVFVVGDNGATIIEDDPNLFPSDALITALKLLEG